MCLLRGTDWVFKHISHKLPCLKSRTLPHAVRCLFLTAEARLWPEVSPCGICGEESCIGTGFTPVNTVCTSQYSSNMTAILRINHVKERSCNQFCRSVRNSDCAFVTFFIHHTVRMRHVVIYGLPRSPNFFYIISQTARFWGKKSLMNIKYEE